MEERLAGRRHLRQALAGSKAGPRRLVVLRGDRRVVRHRRVTQPGRTLAEHRELLDHLRAVPAGVRVIDDIDLTENPKATSAPASAGWIWVRSSPPGARILVDGAETGFRTPARLELQVGEHDVRLVRRGFGTAHRGVVVSQGQTMQFTETLAIE